MNEKFFGKYLCYRDNKLRILNQYSRNTAIILLLLLVSFNAMAQESVNGTVKDSNGFFIPGVSVKHIPTNITTTTNEEGRFFIDIPKLDGTLSFSYVGMVTQEVSVSNKREINIVLNNTVSDLDEVVIVGYGKQSRETVTSSISKLDDSVLENIPFTNAASAMQGTLSGVQVQSTSGQPGSAPRIIIRGGTSINNPNGASPMYIIDGIIRDNMDDISSEDIESLQVLKDAASTAIYGARASNGVVILTTKSGSSGKTTVKYSSSLTTSTAGKVYDLANAEEYIYFNRIGTKDIADIMNPGAIGRLSLPIGYGTGNDLTNNTAFTTQYLTDQNKHKLNEGWKSMIDPIDPSKTIIFQDTDWQDMIYRTATSINNHLGISGGSEKATFNAGIGYMSNEGTVITTKFNRLSFNLAGDIKIRDNLSVYGKTMYTNSNNNEVYGLAHIFYRSAGLPPTAKYTFEDGTLAPGQSRSIGNPVYHLENDKRDNNKENLSLSFGGKWDILPGLSFEPQISLFKIVGDGYSFIPAYWNGATTLNVSRVADSYYSKTTQYQADAVFSYGTTFGSNHNLDVKGGFSYFGRENYALSATGQGAATDLIPTLNASSTMVSMNGEISDQVIGGYFSRVNYNYKEKYLFNLNMRYDGASNLGEDYKWGLFPGVSIGWNVHKEDFWENIATTFSRLKLRGSYGVNGNISGLSDFQAYGEYGVGSVYAGNSAIQNTIIPNPSLQWEQSKTFDFGTDIGLFNNRVNVLFDYFNRVTDNLITSLSLPLSTGFSSIYTNLGSLENKGIEIELGLNVFPAHSAIQWNVGFNASSTKNKILSLPYNSIENNRVGGVNIWDPGSNSYKWFGGLQEGGRIGDYYGLRKLGIYTTDEEAMNGPINTLEPAVEHLRRGGDVKWFDSDGNGKIEPKDYVYLGNPYPRWHGGLSNSLSYKGLNMQLRLDYTKGHYIHNYAKAFMDGNWQGDGNMTKDMVNKSWKEQGDVATMQRFTWQKNRWNNPSISSESIEKGDFLAIREVTIAYTLPAYILNKVHFSSARINVTGNNLHYFTNYKGINPEEGGQDNGRYPIPRNITVGLSLTL